MAVQETKRWIAATDMSPNVEAYATRCFVIVQQGEQRLEFIKSEAPDIIEAIRRAAEAATDEDGIPF